MNGGTLRHGEPKSSSSFNVKVNILLAAGVPRLRSVVRNSGSFVGQAGVPGAPGAPGVDG
jgi:hypothetical protein